MPFVFKRLALFMSITAALAADKTQAFHAPAVADMTHRQTVSLVTIGAETYVAGDKVRAAFGKLVPYDYGVLPVLLVIQNDSSETIRLDQMNAEYVGPRGNRVTATPPGDVRFARAPRRPDLGTGPQLPIPIKKKNPLGAWEIEGRALAAQCAARAHSQRFCVFPNSVTGRSNHLLEPANRSADRQGTVLFRNSGGVSARASREAARKTIATDEH